METGLIACRCEITLE
uniref:Uncharacterized protein n=1 Tax=Macrostomum lignano TaxID=282301 RepID=A0A1I8JDH3_9PLAT